MQVDQAKRVRKTLGGKDPLASGNRAEVIQTSGEG
jgi:hypothetical protein